MGSERGAEYTRHHWAVGLLDVARHHHILEVGCGTGIAAGLIADRLGSGTLLAVDRSEKMVQAAARRNRLHVETGKIRFERGEFGKQDSNLGFYDRIYAFNVRDFWEPDSPQLALAHSLLTPEGRLQLCFQPPRETGASFAEHSRHVFVRCGFDVTDVHLGDFRPASALCVILRRTG